MIQDITPGTEEYLNNNKVSGYVGFDPTAYILPVQKRFGKILHDLAYGK